MSGSELWVSKYFVLLCPDRKEGGNKRCFCPSICPFVACIANNLRTQRPSVPKFWRKVPHLRCDSHTSFKVKRSNIRVGGGQGHIMSSEPGGPHWLFLRDWRQHKNAADKYHVNINKPRLPVYQRAMDSSQATSAVPSWPCVISAWPCQTWLAVTRHTAG